MSSAAVPRCRPWRGAVALSAAVVLTLVSAVAAPWMSLWVLPSATAAPQTSIRGTVHLDSAADVGDVVVSLVVLAERGTSRTSTHLDAEGGYRFEHLAAGDFRLEFRSLSGNLVPRADASLRRATTRFTLERGAAVVRDVRMVRAGTVTGTVGLPGDAKETCVVSLQLSGDGGWRSVTFAELGAGGRYSFDGLAPGSYRVVVVPEGASLARTYSGGSTWGSEATVFALAPGEEVRAAPLRVSRGVTLEGRVSLSADAVAAGVQVVVSSRSEDAAGGGGTWEFTGFTWVRPDGTFRLVGLPEGDQRVTLWDGRTRLADLPVRRASSGAVIDDLAVDLVS